MSRAILVGLLVTTVASSGIASAAALGGISGGLAAGNGAIEPCDTTGFSVTYTTAGGNVTAITVGGIADPGCEGGRLSLAVRNASGAAIAHGGPQTVPTDGDTADTAITVPVTPQPGAAEVEGIAIQIAGP